jgi:hypothetical protein
MPQPCSFQRATAKKEQMPYTKPEVHSLGDAVTIIEYIGKMGTPAQDNRHLPAYDLDE